MLRAVIDTNIFASGLIWKGLPGKIIDNWLEDKFELAVSKEILNEVIRVLRELEAPEIQIAKLENHFLEKAILIEPQIKIQLIHQDPTDNKFLECAVEARANYIVSGDKHLLNLGAIEDIKIITARKFLDLL